MPNINTPQIQANISAKFYIWLLQIFGLAAAYFIIGKLSSFLAIPPGYVTAIWPPSGIALAGILLYGYRVWPGILLGAFLINILTLEQVRLSSENLTSALIFLVISIGASLQALAGAYLLRRYAGFPNSLKQKKDVLLFLLYGGLLSALINATLSVSMLVGLGRISTENFLINWGVWWAGDVLGIFIFTPLILAWMLPSKKGWQSRRLQITIPALLMMTLTTAAVFYELESSNKKIELEFKQQAEALNNALKMEIQLHLNVLGSLKSYYAATETVSRNEFKIFTKLSLNDVHGIQALGWNPIIQAAERKVFEKNIQREGYPNFQITERDSLNNMVRATDRPRYVPITFLEPYQGNESAFGYDVNSNELRHEALDRARDSGEIALTSRITLVQEQAKQQGVIASMPIYRNGLPNQTLEEKRNAISGYAVAVFRTGDIVISALKNQNTDGLSYRLIDITAAVPEQLLFSSSTVQEKNEFSAKNTLNSRLAMPIGGRIWQFEVVPKPDYFVRHRSGYTWLILLLGLVLTSLVIFVALVVSGRTKMLQQLVSERTAELERQYEISYATLEEKQQAHTRLNLILNATGEGIFGIGLDGNCIFVNCAAVTMLGYASEQDILGKHSHQLHHHSHADGSCYEIRDCPIYKALSGTVSNPLDSEVYWRKDGSSFPVQYQAHPIKDGEKIIGCVVSFTDITERKKAEARLSILSLALEQSQSAVIITDLETKIEYVNEAFVKSTGYSREDIIGQKPSFFSSGKTSEVIYQTMWTALNKGDAWQGEITNLNKWGEEFIELTWISPIHQADGAITHYLGVKEDITERKRLEFILLAAKERAESLALAKSQFLTNMSHEIRTPMSAIVGLSQLALNRKFDPEALDYLAKINRASVSLLGILNGILDLSKLEAGAMTLERQPFYMDALQDRLCSLFNLAAQQKVLDFNIDVAADVPLQLMGDALRLQQVLINLLGNAIKFTECGAVTLTITLQQLDASEARLLFCVTDTGIGMSLEDQAKLFKPFSQVDESSQRRFMGTGLGLVISKDLLTLMDSELSLVSTPGLGSSFSFELILGMPSISLQNWVPQKSEVLSEVLNLVLEQVKSVLTGKRILVVEDNDFNQQVVSEYLKLSGITVKIANNGAEALMMLEQDEFDGVFMDIHMPVMDGFEATKRIRAQPCFAHLPIIALTAGVSQEERDLCMAVGMNDFISKPINSTLLLPTLAHWLKPDHLVDENILQDVKQWLDVDVLDVDVLDVDVLDVDVLKELIGDDPATVAEFLDYFHVSAMALSTEIIAALNTGQVATVIAATHKLSSSAGSVGAIGLSNLCAELESAGKANDQARLNTLLPRFEREWHRVDKSLNSGMG